LYLGNDGVSVFDLSDDPHHPVLLARHDAEQNVYDFAVVGNHVYARVEGEGAINLELIETPAPPARIREEFALDQNWPNPFNPATTISFELKRPQHAILAVYDIAGRLVKTLDEGFRVSGPHQVTWDGTDRNGARVSSGVYVYRLEADSGVTSRKLVVMK